MLYEASRIWVLVLRGREINLLPVRERSQRLWVRKGSRALVIRARVELGLPDGQDKCYVSMANSPDIGGGIALRGRDPEVWGLYNPSQLRDKSRYILFLHPLV